MDNNYWKDYWDAYYNFMDFSKFDVYKHIKSKAGKFVFLFLNEPNQNYGVHLGQKIGFVPIKGEHGMLLMAHIE